jgi:WD40 repeat protein
MAIEPVPKLTDIPPFPPLSDRAAGTYNAKAFAFGTHLSDTFNDEIAAVAHNVVHNANEILLKVTAATDAAATAVAAAQSTKDAAADAASALASRQAAAQSASTAEQSATSAQQAKQSVDQSLASIAGGPVASINGLTGIVNIKVPTTGDVVVSARKDYLAPAYLPCDGGTYLRSAYRDLAAMIPVEYPTSKITSMGRAPTDAGFAVALSRDNLYMAVGLASSPYMEVYKRSSSTGFSSLNPSAYPATQILGLDFSADSVYLALAATQTPFFGVYKRSGDVFTRLTNPTQPAGSCFAVAFAPSGTHVALGGQGNDRLALYSRSGDVFTKQAIAAIPTAGNGNAVAFSSDSAYLAVGTSASPFVSIYKRSGNVLEKLADPDLLPTASVESVAFSPDGNYLAVVGSGTNKLIIYQRNGDVFSRIATPALPSAASPRSVVFSPNGVYLVVGDGSSGGFSAFIFRQTGNGFAQVPNPPGMSAGANCAAFSGDSLTMAFAHSSTPFLTAYRVEYNTNTQFKLPTQTVDGLGLLGYIKT